MDVTIVPVPLTKGPDAENKGRWWWVTIDRPNQLTQEEFIRLKEQVGLLVGPGNPAARNPDPSSPHILELPKLSGHVTLFVGYEVPAGEFTVDTFDRINELSPVGAFYCLGVDPDDPSALGAVLEARGYSVMWTFESGNAGSRVAEPPPDTVATWAWLRGPGLADIRIAPAGSEGEQYQAAEGTFPLGVTPPWSQPCTDDNQ